MIDLDVKNYLDIGRFILEALKATGYLGKDGEPEKEQISEVAPATSPPSPILLRATEDLKDLLIKWDKVRANKGADYLEQKEYQQRVAAKALDVLNTLPPDVLAGQPDLRSYHAYFTIVAQ